MDKWIEETPLQAQEENEFMRAKWGEHGLWSRKAREIRKRLLP